MCEIIVIVAARRLPWLESECEVGPASCACQVTAEILLQTLESVANRLDRQANRGRPSAGREHAATAERGSFEVAISVGEAAGE